MSFRIPSPPDNLLKNIAASGNQVITGTTIAGHTFTVPNTSAFNLPDQHFSVNVNDIAEMRNIILGINDRIQKIEKRLDILTPNRGLEEKYKELKSLREQYEALEAELDLMDQAVNILSNS